MNGKITACVIAAFLLPILALTACRNENDQIRKIRERGVLRVGVKVDVPRFGYLNPNTGKIEGMEIDLARALAKDILGNDDAVTLTNITAQTRGSMLDNGELDIVVATFTITDERRKSFNFSRPYFTDELGYLVRAELSIKHPEDLNGKIVGVAKAGTAKVALEDECTHLGIKVKMNEYASYPEVKNALVGGDIEAFIADKSILYGYLDDACILLDDGFNPQQYGIASTLKNDKLAGHVDSLLGTWEKGGELDAIREKWGL